MIKDVASILKGFIDEETKKLDEYSLEHRPTIGLMYEGLTSEVLDRAIPTSLGLDIKSGFIHDGAGNMTGQIDCMLVKGEGEKIPYTDNYKWHIKDVISVFEVKKNLYSADLADAFDHLRGVLDKHSQYAMSGAESDEVIDVSSALMGFSQITGIYLPEHKSSYDLPVEYELIYHTLVSELLSPVRIILGYHGFKSEYTLRKSLIDFIDKNIGKKGYGIGSFPQLIICDNYSLVKMNGQPYVGPMLDDHWCFYASSRSNPIHLILEFLWTRLSRQYNLGGLWGDDLDSENLIGLLSGKIKQSGDNIGWEYNYIPAKEEALEKEPSRLPWEPCYLTDTQFTIINILCKGNVEKIDDPELISYIEEKGEKFEDFVKSLVQTRLVSLHGKELRLNTRECTCMILPDGRYVADENNTGRLTRWSLKFIDELKK